jgi:putative hemolysin
MDLVPEDAIDRLAAARATPPLIKAYLRLGGVIGEGAFIDHAFNTTDVCLVLDVARSNAAQRALYARAGA